jgi:hypothetical protein
MIEILGMKVSKKISCRARKVWLLPWCSNGISRTFADSQQAENNHEIKQEFKTKVQRKGMARQNVAGSAN